MAIVSQPNNDLVVDGDVVVRDFSGATRIRLDSGGSIFVHNADGDVVLQWEMPGNNLRIGGHDRDGDLVMFSQAAGNISNTNNATFHLNTENGAVFVGGGGVDGQVVCRDGDRNQRLFLDSAEARCVVGANGQAGSVVVQSEDNEPRIELSGTGANIRCGGGSGGGGDGDMLLFPSGAEISDNSSATVHIDGGGANIRCGGGSGGGGDGDLLLFPNGVDISDTAEASIHLNGENGNARVGAITFADGSTQATAASTEVITAVIAGDGLVGGGSAGEVEISLSPGVGQDIVGIESRVQQLEFAVQQLQITIQQLQGPS